MQKAHFDAVLAADLDWDEPSAAQQYDEALPEDLEKLSKMATKFPEVYATKLEAYLMQQKLYIGQLKNENEKLTSETNLLKEDAEQRKYYVQQLTAALQKENGQREACAESPIRLTDNFRTLNVGE